MCEPLLTICQNMSLLLLLIILLTAAAPSVGSAEIYDDPSIVKPTPTLRVAGADDLTTVLLINNDGLGGRLGENHGRFLSVRPELGLLTSTARTFIQEGITTEYATQVVGTTLNNGRQYAQYLKKTSRVLFENGQVQPSVVTSWVGDTQTRSYLESHNDLLNAEAPDWRDIDDRLRLGASAVDDEFVGNTDYFKQRHTSTTQLRVKEKVAASSIILMDKTVSKYFLAQSGGYNNDISAKLSAHKVLPIEDLLTLTVKNHFEPSGYQRSQDAQDDGRSAKVYYQQLLQEEKQESEQLQSQSQPRVPFVSVLNKKKQIATVTYYGFADFTTLVGDSLIVFSPSTTQQSAIVGHVTSISGMATLRTSDFYTHSEAKDNIDVIIKSTTTLSSSSRIESAFVDDETMKQSVVNASTFTIETTPALDVSVHEKSMISQQNVRLNEAKPMYSLPTDQEILEIYASLSKAQAGDVLAKTSDAKKPSNVPTDQVDKNSQIHGGATTIFIDDDPFANFIEPTSVVTSQSIQASTEISNKTLAYKDTTSSVEATTEISKEDSAYNETTTFNLELPTTTYSDVDDEANSTTPKSSFEDTTVFEESHINLPQEIVTTENTTSESTTTRTTTTANEETTLPTEESTTTTNSDAKTANSDDNDDDDYVTESDNISLMDNENEDYDNGENGSDEVDLFYKTLYTTYTYLTTFFQDKSTTVSSHTEIFTNIVTSTLGSSKTVDDEIKSSDTLSDTKIIVTPVTNLAATTTTFSKYMIPDEIQSLIHPSSNEQFNVKEDSANEQTNYLNDAIYTKTFYTTYTYYTTIFADTETEIMSRTEVFTNFVTESDISNSNDVDPTNISPSQAFKSEDPATVSTNSLISYESAKAEDEKLVTLITDVRSSSSNGNQQIVGQVEDQVSSESNTEEILPSPTLLLQTSFTTFTYYTTMYVLDSTNVVSRLETITNIATETLQPTKMFSNDDATFPITYFTTFTYWTKLAKNGEISTISREETISNIIEPTQSAVVSSIDLSTSLQTMSVDLNQVLNLTSEMSELTTFYTTYTYYTTSYDANKTVTDSRYETIVNVITPSVSDLISVSSAVEPTPIITKAISTNSVLDFNKADLVLYDYKHIVDADGVSTLYFTTKIQSTTNDEGRATEFTSSTSSLYIDESKKSHLATVNSDSASLASQQPFKTGLVRLIEGTRVANNTTTLYQSKVIGTIIENRYAQIIESTSSFLFAKTVETVLPNAVTTDDLIVSTTQQVNLQTVGGSVEGSINSDIVTENLSSNDGEEDFNADTDNDQLSYQTMKRTFAPVIRPFASRNRPTFAPKQKTLSASSATIITRSDITPTITATPALKSVGGRYSTSRRGVISNAPTNPTTSSSRRLFGRPFKSSTTASGVSSQSVNSSTGFAASSRNRFASSTRLLPVSSSRRLSSNASYRPTLSSNNNFRLSVANSRQRIKSTATATISQSVTRTPTLDNEEEENSSTEEQLATNEDEDKSAQNSRRNQNPLLRFRRPLSRPSGFTPVPRSSNTSLPTISPRRNPLSGRAKAAPTTTTTTTTSRPRPRSFQRPTVSSLQGRNRPQSNLFPPRGLFQQQQQLQKEEVATTDNPNDSDNDSEYDDNDDGEEDDQNEANRRRRRVDGSNPSNLSRQRREADSLNRNRFRFRRPKTVSTEEPPNMNLDNAAPSGTTSSSTRAKINSRFGSRYRQKQQSSSTTSSTTSHRSIRPTRPTLPRAQFTLRDKDTTTIRSSNNRQGGSNFRRQQGTTTLRRNQSVSGSGLSSSSANSRRLKSYNNNVVDNTHQRSTSKSRNHLGNGSNGSGGPSRGRVTMRGRKRIDYNLDEAAIEQGTTATITITHIIPAEVTVPVVNGHITEYKNIVTGKTSIEVVGPHQYSAMLGNNGQTSLFLTKEDSSINSGGATELTRYLLHDSLTTTVTFTPTTIRGRKTSFSHVLPSTVYSVENIVSTIQPQLSANAPLANILLSQLLLGNINLPANPILGAVSAVEPSASLPIFQQQPITEYRTHTSTYVTTIYDGKSTILPITFQGKKILTTVFDTTAQTITATEYSVDTIVNTPTQQLQQQQQQQSGQVAQVNSLLLQQLLLQQQQQQQQQQQNVQIAPTMSPQILLLNENLQHLDDDDAHDNIDDFVVEEPPPAVLQSSAANKNRKKTRKSNGNKRTKQQTAADPQEVEESSVITLYVSGRRPGEFSTILSTVHNGYNGNLGLSSLHKRHAADVPQHHKIQETLSIGSPEDLYKFEGSERIQTYLRPITNINSINSDCDDECGDCDCEWKERNTISLESIIGDVDLWYAEATKATTSSSNEANTLSINNLSNVTNSLYFLA